MRRKLLFAVVIILAFLLATAATALAADEQYRIVRVKLSIGEPAEFSFFVDGNYTVNGVGLERQQYTVRLEGGSLGLYFGSERLASGASIKLVRHLETPGRNNFIWMYNTKAGTGTANRLKYVGDMEFIVEQGHIAAVNHVYIEDYLCGVVSHEMGNAWLMEALKAQAIAARNYVEQNMKPSGPYDVVDTTANQVYYGYEPMHNNVINAVNQTAKTVLTCGGQLAEVFFGASNGGFTEIPQHVWNADNPIKPYHVIQQDDYDVQNSRSKQDVLIFPKVMPNGAADISYQYNDDNGVVYTGAQEAAKAANYLKDSGLPVVAALGYTSLDDITGINSITPQPVGGQHDILDHYGNNACGCYRNAVINMNVLATRPPRPEEQDENGQPATVQEPVTIDITIDMKTLADKNSPYFAFDKHPSMRLFTVTEDSANWYIYHRGFGHGIGLSQRGAQQRANSSDPNVKTFDKILEFYYPNTELTVQGYEAPALTSAALPDHSNAVMIEDIVNVRSGANTSTSSLDRLPLGARIEVVQENVARTGTIVWDKVYFNGRYAYIAASVGADVYIAMDASPERERFNVTYITNGCSGIASQSVQHADSITSPATSKPHYTLEGWYFDAGLTSKVTFPYIVTRNMTLYAKWTPIVYSIGYDLRGGEAANPASYTVESGAVTLNNPSRHGYAFAGWTGTGLPATPVMNVTIPAGSSGNRAYYAHWTPVTYYISYNLNGGSPVSNPGSFTIESPGFTLNNPTRTGYAFAGWTGTGLSGNTASVTIPAGSTGNREYTANWAPYVCTVNFDSQGGTPVGAVRRGVWETIAEPYTSRYGYNFLGWFDGAGARVSFPYTVTGNATLYARWAQQPQTNLLAGAGLSSGYLNRPFSPAVTKYKITVGEHDGSFTLTPFKQFDGASMTINKRAQSSYTVNLASGKSAKITVKVTLGKKSKTYTFTVTRPKSSNNYLSSITASAGTWSQAFDPNVANYTLYLDENTKSVAVRAAAAAGKAARVSPASKKISLNNGQSKTLKITVRAQSGARRTYTVTVVRAPSTNANLKSLKASGLSPGFSPGVTEYTVVLPANKSSASVSARAVGYKARVTIDDARRSSKKVALENGQSAVVRVVVAAQAGNTKEYLITVIRQ